jgi:hypothetical protein
LALTIQIDTLPTLAGRLVVDYLVERQTEAREARDWAKFAAEQLALAYAPTDAVYDQD